MNHKVIVYAELNGGKEITEKELRLIIHDLERRGFHGWYERQDSNKSWLEIFNTLGQKMGILQERKIELGQ